METWIVKEITLWRRHAERPSEQVTLPGATVSWESPIDASSAAATASPGFLLASGVGVDRLADVPWVPTHLSFRAVGYLETREFEITGWDADPQSGKIKFPIP